jgi:putative PIN family toxin of toxin-antitoxin system
VKPRRVVVDTSILLSAFLVGGNPRTLFEAARAGKIRLITSPTILAEFASILKREFFWPDVDIREALMAIGRHVELVKPKRGLAMVEDEADNRVLECDSEGKADMIVSGDRHLLSLERFGSVPILRASAFVATLR